MPRPKSPPKYQLHKTKGSAITRIGGRIIYLGKHGSPASYQKFAQVVSDWELTGSFVAKDSLPIKSLLLAYLKHADTYYRKDGRHTSEHHLVVYAARLLREHFGELPVGQFGPRRLQILRDAMIAKGWRRRTVNSQTKRVCRIFKWGASQEMVSGEVIHALASVDALKAGRSSAKESRPQRPVPEDVFYSTLQQIEDPQIRDMLLLQRWTGMRSGELVVMRPCDIDRSGDVWTYVPKTHKTEHHGKRRIVSIGPRSQSVLLRYLARGEQMWCFPASKNPNRPFRQDSYRNAIKRAAKRARVEHWSPHRLRHTAATEARRAGGLEAAQQMLGHSTAKITELYAEKNLGVAQDVARKIG